ncbi:MAG: hypothetical protein MMC33_000458 [Icmadophila ericetorum]|nr:hypothetical protein [Icmadophila ericetorum]
MFDSSIVGKSEDCIPPSLVSLLNGDLPLLAPQHGDGEPARKRRKVAAIKDSKRSEEDARWENHLTIARVKIELCFPEDDDRIRPKISPPPPDNSCPVAAHCIVFDGGFYEWQLKTLDGRSLCDLSLRLTALPNILRILDKIINMRKPNKNSYAKASFSVARCTNSHGATHFNLEAKIMWRNSQSLEEGHSNKENDLLLDLTPELSSIVYEPWSPRDFYGNVHVPDPHSAAADSITIDNLECQLYPFQKRTVRWLLHREGVEQQEKDLENPPTSENLPHGFIRTIDVDGRTCLVNHWLGIVTTNEDLLSTEIVSRGGILAEEMGLGKTCEILGLICLNPSSREALDRLSRQTGAGRSTPGTLIITPPSILEQWKTEIQTRAPSLHVMTYEGIRYGANEDDAILKDLVSHDVVLTTYNILAKEIHYSGVTPDRSLRNNKKYERRQSPLMKLTWWRVVLDECQMVESGVSNAAKVARMIPRIHAWAVSGTPLKKDAKDLLGLLIFLRYNPYCNSSQIWDSLVTRHKYIFRDFIGNIALRHTKELVREDIQLPAQKRVVLTVPFTHIEEQHYSNLFQEMCEDCGVDTDGSPLMDTWDPHSSSVIEKMRSWLTRLRQTCLHPEVGDRNRRALGHGDGPLRTVGEVLQVMMEHNDTTTRQEERTLLLSQIRRGQILEHAKRSQEALEIWQVTLTQASNIVQDCRKELSLTARASEAPTSASQKGETPSPDGNPSSRTGLLRTRLRSALELEHISAFFVANAFYQIKTDENLTKPDSDRSRELEKAETEMYERAKFLRKEILIEADSKALAFMKRVKDKARDQSYVQIPSFTTMTLTGGIESRGVLTQLENLCDWLDRQAEQLDEWREKMNELLSLPLVDQEDTELQGDEYETSTKQQEEVYVYMEALRAMVADRHDMFTGQSNILISHEMGLALQQANEGFGHSPELMKSLLTARARLKQDPSLGSIRGIITALRGLKFTIYGSEVKGSSRAKVEGEIVDMTLNKLTRDLTKQTKVLAALEKEIELYRDTMNARLEYYRQLQAISDAVAPYEQELTEEALQNTLAEMQRNELKIQDRLATLKARARYLVHLRDESTADDVQRMCVICQQTFEIGALTSCGHSYCKECLQIWWNTHKNCPTCKKKLSRNDFHQISYKPLELTMQEELNSKSTTVGSSTSVTSIYSGISKVTLSQIKNIDVEGSFGTKIDTLARHLLWIREHDPGAKSIVFSQFKDFLDILARAFRKFKIGFTSIDTKGGIEDFKNDPGIECFFLHAKAYSSGINLVNATHVFLCEPLINTAIELQAIARVHRIGQHHQTTVWMYLVEDTVEKTIYDISVDRRLSHISSGKAVTTKQKQKEKEKEMEANGDALPSDFAESTIEAANSMELQDAPLAKLLAKGPGGGELVDQADLWNCLFHQKTMSRLQVSHDAEKEVTRHLRAEAAEKRNRQVGPSSLMA